MSRRDAYVAIADPTRREILELLHERGTMVAGEIAANFTSASRPGISRHLRVLKECGVVTTERAGKQRNYRLHSAPLEAIRDGWLADFANNQAQSLWRLRAIVEADTKPSGSSQIVEPQ